MNKKKLASFATTILLVGCAGTAAVIKPVEDKQIDDLKASETAKPIQFTKVVVKLKRGEHIGAVQAGLLCVPGGNLNWKGGRITVDSDEFTDAFKEELEKYSFKTVGDANALFEDPSSWKSEILVAGLVKELKANICYPMAGFGNFNSSKGEAFIKVDWQIYSKLDRAVVHSVTTEGSSKLKESTASGDSVAVLNAFSQASRNLLADKKFREIVSKGGEAIKDTAFKSGDSIVISTGKSQPIGKEPAQWPSAVVTVFAGTGSGSGFAISENLILTNHHVVGESNSLTIKFDNGLQVTGRVIASNSGHDVAVIKVDASLPKHFRIQRLSPSVGTEVFAIGSPLGEKYQSTITRGIISSYREENKKTLIQSDVTILPGNSGGPLVNNNGEVVGIAVSGVVIGNSFAGMNFFIPIDEALKILGTI